MNLLLFFAANSDALFRKCTNSPHRWMVLIAFFTIMGCHPWSLFRSVSSDEGKDFLAWDEDALPGGLAAEDWADEFTVDTKGARSTTSRRSSALAPSQDASEQPAITVLADEEFDSEPHAATEFVISDLDDEAVPNGPTDDSHLPRSTSPADEVVSAASAETLSGEDDLSGQRSVLDEDDVGRFIELPDALLLETELAAIVSQSEAPSESQRDGPAPFAVPMVDLAELVSTAEPATASHLVDADKENGFFRNILIDHRGSTGGPQMSPGARDYSQIRRMFQHPDTSTRYRSQSQYSRPFQRPPKDK